MVTSSWPIIVSRAMCPWLTPISWCWWPQRKLSISGKLGADHGRFCRRWGGQCPWIDWSRVFGGGMITRGEHLSGWHRDGEMEGTCAYAFLFLQPHRISVRSVLVNRKTSKDAACTMIIGRGAPLGPSCVKASAVTHSSSIISWLPSNSNFQHTVCINNVEVKTLRPGTFKHMITGNLLIYIQSE